MDMLSDERLIELAREAQLVANICANHGELDGRTAAQSQARALMKEIAARGLNG